MRKLLIFAIAVLISGSLLAGGLVTNTNQSAMFTRLQNRNASTDIDAAYFNPAGLTKLGDGFFFSVNNQTISQTKKVISTNQFLAGSPKEYVGKVSAPIFPGAYAVFNTGKFSISAGFNPVGGGGGAEYKKGLPSFEVPVAGIAPGLSSQGIPTSAYSADIYFKGSSVYFGYQANIAYKINDMLSIAAGVRLVTAKNTYSGFIKNISINPNYPAFGAKYNGAMNNASQFFADGQTYLNGVSSQLAATAGSLQPIVTGGGADVPLANGDLVGLTPTQIATLQGTITALGGNPAGLTIGQTQAFFSGASTTYAGKAVVMGANAAGTVDRIVDAEESGTGITPIVSANFSPSDKLDIAVRYEFQTELELKTKVAQGKGGGIFIDGDKVSADMPAMLAAGVNYRPTSKLSLEADFTTYFDKNVDYDGSETINVNMIDKNFFEYGLGLEYALTEKFRVSGGWTHTTTGVNLNYQSDQTYSTNTNTFGAGFGYRISELIDLNIGGQYTVYKDGVKSFTDIAAQKYTETYKKSTWLVAVGLDFHFGKK
jgi:long-chain fatty acid transport protein